MKKLLTLTGIASIGTVLVLISTSEATAASASEISRKEALLAQSGFRVVTVTTPKQKEAVKGLAQGRCSAVTFNKKLFYVFPTATGIRRPSRLSRVANQRRCNLRYSQKIN